MSEPAATPEQSNGTAQPEAAAEPVIEYRRPIGRNVPEHIRAALEGAEADTKAAQEAKTKAEAKEPEKPAEPELKQPPESLSRQHAALTRRQRAVEEAERKSQAAVAAAEAKAKEHEAKVAELEALDEMALLQRVAERKGLTLDQLIKRGIARVANKGQLPPEEQTKVEIEAARKEAAEAKAEAEKLRKERDEDSAKAKETEAQNTIDAWKNQASHLALANEDRLPLITALPPEEIAERAYDVMSQYYQTTKEQTGTGVVPSTEEVLLYLEQQEQADFERKEERRRKLQTPPEKAGADPGADNPEQKRPARTLTNRDASERASSRKRPTSERDLIAYAAEAIPD